MRSNMDELIATRTAHDLDLATKLETLHTLYHSEDPEKLSELTAKLFPQPGLATAMEEIHTLYHNSTPKETQDRVWALKDGDAKFSTRITVSWDAAKGLIYLNNTHKDLSNHTPTPLTPNGKVV